MAAGDDSLSFEERRRFLHALKGDGDFRDEVRREVLTEELLAVPERLVRIEQQSAENSRQIAELAQTVTGLTSAVNSLIDHQAELRSDVNSLVETTGRLLHLVQEGFGEMRQGLSAIETKFDAKFDQVGADIRDIKQRLAS